MNKMRKTLLVAAAMTLGATAALAADGKPPAKPAGEEASIPFLSLKQSIREWQADGREGLWIQDARKQWYYATLQAPCIGLDFAVGIGFESRTMNTLDRFSSVVVPREGRCQFMSMVKSDPPPDAKKNRKTDSEEAGKQ